MYLERTEAPSEQPVTLAEAKAQLRVLSSAEDGLVSGLIATAAALLEGRAGMLGGRALVTQRWRYKIDYFPRIIEMPMTPLRAVQAIKYLDDAGAEQTIDPALYIVDTGTWVGRIRPAYNVLWPIPQPTELAVTIDFECGFGAASAVPMTIKQAMFLLINHWFHNRGSIGALPEGAQLAVEALLSGERHMTF